MAYETTKKVLRYTLTPQIIPRFQDLWCSGFAYIAFFMAQIYNAARLLPPGHPYLNPANMGRYGIRNVIAEAGRNLRWQKENIDQIIVYGIMLLGFVLLALQFTMLILAVFVQGAHAALGPVPDTFASYFLVPAGKAKDDIAFVLLDRVFGVPGLFVDAANGTTCVAQGIKCFDLGLSSSSAQLTADGHFRTTAAAGGAALNLKYSGNAAISWPWPFHQALHKLFEAYSIGILLIAVFIFLYFVVAVIAETAQSGTPFGRRFNHVWAPLRLIAAIGLLIPLNYGLNSGQWILLHAAKWGSGFATNGWNLFYTEATKAGKGTVNGTMPTPLGPKNTLIAPPTAPPVNTFVEFATILATCRVSYERMYHQRTDRATAMDIDAYVVNPAKTAGGMAPKKLETTKFKDVVDEFDGGDIQIMFGTLRDNEYQTRAGRISPLCGIITLPIASYPDSSTHENPANPGPDYIEAFYYEMLQEMWQDIKSVNALTNAPCIYMDDATLQPMLQAAEDAGGKWLEINRTNFTLITHPEVQKVIETSLALNKGGGSAGFGCLGQNYADRYLPIFNNPNAPLPTDVYLDFHRRGYQYLIDSLIDGGALIQLTSPEWTEDSSALGWGGAAVWYNKVAELNGSLVSAAFGMPEIKQYPLIMEHIRAKKAGADTDTPGQIRHQLYRGPDAAISLSDEEENEIAKALYYAQTVWHDHDSETKPAGNIYIDIINAVFGTSGLFDIQKNADLGVHPLAQLSAIGKSILETGIRNLGYSAAAGLGGGLINLFGVHMVGKVGMAASNFLLQISMVGLTLGFILYYVVPLLPFIYFFFAVGGWVKGIFEAMVGVPLWALAHIRIDGNGLPGDAAMAGYYLILEIFLRPILILFGFLAAITVFAAQVQVLHEIWPIVVSNTTGFDVKAANPKSGYDPNQTGGIRFLRGAIDKFFFTAIYAIVVYMLGLASFKMIDLVPNYILRWMGASVSSFGDQSGDPADNLVRNSYVGASMFGGNLKQGLQQGGAAVGQGAEAIKDLSARSR